MVCHAAFPSEGSHFPVQDFRDFPGVVDGDDAPAFKDRVHAVADNFRAGIIFRVPAPTHRKLDRLLTEQKANESSDHVQTKDNPQKNRDFKAYLSY